MTGSFRKGLSVGLTVLLVLTASCSDKQEGARESSKQGKSTSVERGVGGERVLFLETLGGNKVPLTQFRGRIVFLTFFATWNKASVEQLVELSKLYGKYRKHRVSVIAVSMDKNPGTVLKPFVEKHKIKFPVYTNGREVAGYFGGIGRTPSTLILKRDGSVFKRFVGKKSFKFLNDRLVEMLSHRM